MTLPALTMMSAPPAADAYIPASWVADPQPDTNLFVSIEIRPAVVRALMPRRPPKTSPRASIVMALVVLRASTVKLAAPTSRPVAVMLIAPAPSLPASMALMRPVALATLTVRSDPAAALSTLRDRACPSRLTIWPVAVTMKSPVADIDASIAFPSSTVTFVAVMVSAPAPLPMTRAQIPIRRPLTSVAEMERSPPEVRADTAAASVPLPLPATEPVATIDTVPLPVFCTKSPDLPPVTVPVDVMEIAPPLALACTPWTAPEIVRPPASWAKSMPPAPECFSVNASPEEVLTLVPLSMSTWRSVAPCPRSSCVRGIAPRQMKWLVPTPVSVHPEKNLR